MLLAACLALALARVAHESNPNQRDPQLGGGIVKGESYLRHLGNFDEWRRMLNTHLRPEDRRNFKAVTGQSLGDLLTDKLWETLTPGDWENVMGTTDRIIHPLNSKGLQVLRALLSERIIDYLRRRRSPRARKGSLAEKFERDGILVLPLLSYDRRLELS